MGQICMHGLVAALCRSMEIYQREREREMEQEEKRKAEGGSQAGDQPWKIDPQAQKPSASTTFSSKERAWVYLFIILCIAH